MRGRKPSYTVVLSGQERAELERWQRTPTMPSGLVMRGRAVLLLAGGLPVKDVMVRCQMTGKTVRKWARRFVKQRLSGLQDLPGRGGKPAFSP